jgi:hypothetical protein
MKARLDTIRVLKSPNLTPSIMLGQTHFKADFEETKRTEKPQAFEEEKKNTVYSPRGSCTLL